MDGYLSKPVKIDNLHRAIVACLSQQETAINVARSS